MVARSYAVGPFLILGHYVVDSPCVAFPNWSKIGNFRRSKMKASTTRNKLLALLADTVTKKTIFPGALSPDCFQ